MPEFGLGLGRYRATYRGRELEWLFWYDESGNRLLTPEERVKEAEAKAERLAEKLKALGIDPNSV